MLAAIAFGNHAARVRIAQSRAQHIQSRGRALTEAAANRLVKNETAKITVLLALIRHRATFRQTPKPVKPPRARFKNETASSAK